MPAGLPWGSPGIGDEMEGAVQQAAQAGRQSMGLLEGVPTVRVSGQIWVPAAGVRHAGGFRWSLVVARKKPCFRFG